jgi:hypothetical protein
VNEVNRNSIDLGAELRKVVIANILIASVEVVLPVRHQLAQVGAVDAIRPVFVVKLRRPASDGEDWTKDFDIGLKFFNLDRVISYR